jgi:diamine N-acetyltransferase
MKTKNDVPARNVVLSWRDPKDRLVEITFKMATVADTGLIFELAERIWNIHYPGIITQGQIDYMLARNYSADAVRKQMSEGQNYTIILLDHVPVGYYSVSQISEQSFYLNKLYVDIYLHRKGIGAVALAHMLANDCKGYTELSLQVNRRNAKAINFYFRAGFTIDRVEDFDIGGGYSMDDFIMVLHRQ